MRFDNIGKICNHLLFSEFNKLMKEKMGENNTESSANIEWKQNKDDEKYTRNSRRLDLKKLALADEKAQNKVDVGLNRIKNNSPNLRKMRAKIKEVFDEDEEDENSPILVFNLENESSNSSLVQSLKEDEKRKMQVEQTLKNQTMQQTAGKMEAALRASKQTKELGLKKVDMKNINRNMLNVTDEVKTFSNIVKQHVKEKEKIEVKKVSTYEDTKDLVKGLRQIKQAKLTANELINEKQAEKLKAEELIEIGKEKDDRKAAKLIIKKTGREDEKNKNKLPKDKVAAQKDKVKAQKELSAILKQQNQKGDFDGR